MPPTSPKDGGAPFVEKPPTLKIAVDGSGPPVGDDGKSRRDGGDQPSSMTSLNSKDRDETEAGKGELGQGSSAGATQTPRTQYARRKAIREATALQMMMHMDADKVKSIQEQFASAGGSVDMCNFVRIMRKHLPKYNVNDPAAQLDPANDGSPSDDEESGGGLEHFSPTYKGSEREGTLQEGREHPDVTLPPLTPTRAAALESARQLEVTANLVELFREVDINGDGDMEWDEFTRFIVEKASLFQDALALEKTPPYLHNTRLNSENIDVEDRHRHTETIDQICPITSSNQFAVIEAHSKFVSLYDSFNGNLVTNIYQNAVPLSLCHIESKRCLVASCADMTLNVWNLEDPHSKWRYSLRSKLPTKNAVMSLTWVEPHQLLYAGSYTGDIGAYDIFNESADVKAHFQGHSDIVMNMIAMQGLNNVVSASLDTTVRIWDTYTEQETNKLVGHSKGVFSLSYNSDHRFIVSAGFDHEAYVWSPFVNTLLFKLKGHMSSLVGCHCVENSNELVTADSSGTFKIWDLRNFMCCQTFTSEHEQGDLNDLSGMSSFAHVKLPPGGSQDNMDILNPEDDEDDYRIICGTKRLFFFDQFRAKAEPVTDALPVTMALFNSVSLTIMVISGKSVKIWDAILGSLKTEYSNLSESDLSCACLDDRERKFILGDVAGNMSVYNYSNGALMKRFPPFDDGATVCDLIYCGHVKCVIASNIYGNIRIYDEFVSKAGASDKQAFYRNKCCSLAT